jgi:hypothetical protein
VDVGFGDGRDPHTVRCGELAVDVDVAAGVNDEGFALGLAADEIAGLGEVLVVDALDKHRALLRWAGGSFRERILRSPHLNENTPGGISQTAPDHRPTTRTVLAVIPSGV